MWKCRHVDRNLKPCSKTFFSSTITEVGIEPSTFWVVTMSHPLSCAQIDDITGVSTSSIMFRIEKNGRTMEHVVFSLYVRMKYRTFNFRYHLRNYAQIGEIYC